MNPDFWKQYKIVFVILVFVLVLKFFGGGGGKGKNFRRQNGHKLHGVS